MSDVPVSRHGRRPGDVRDTPAAKFHPGRQEFYPNDRRFAELFDTAASLHKLGRSWLAVTFYDRAEPLLRRCLQAREARLGKDHPDTAATLYDLAVLYQAQSQYDSAEPIYQRAILRKTKQARLWISRLHLTCDGADFDESKT